MNERNFAATFLFLEMEYARRRTRITAAAYALGNLGMALARNRMNPDMCLSHYSHIAYPVYWTKLSEDYMECICALANTNPSGGTAIYKAVVSFMRDFLREAETTRPWVIFIFTDGQDERSTAQEKVLAMVQLTLIHNLPSARVDINFLTMCDSQEDNIAFASTGCHVIQLGNPVDMGVLIAAKLQQHRSTWPDIGILMDTSRSMDNRV